jgi:uncharacterized protein with PIN domain
VSCIKVEPPKNGDVSVNCPKVDEKIYGDLREYNTQLFNKLAECQKNLKEVSKDFSNILERNVYLENQTNHCPECPEVYQPQNTCEGEQ